ncbi:MAG: hypothetical protein ACLQGP_42220 [Isosphaeraceae bacterium]
MHSENDSAGVPARGNLAASRDWLRVQWLVALAGLLSGLAAFGIGEAAYNRVPARKVKLNTMGMVADAVTGANQSLAVVRNGAIACAVLGLCLGGILGIAGGLSRRSWSSASKAGAFGATLGAVLAGGVALATLQFFADARVSYANYDIIISIGMHGLAWSLAGVAGGLAFGVGLGDRRLIVRAMLAGLVGAVLGAIAFDVAGAFFFPLAETGDPVSTTWPSRLVARLWVTAATAACIVIALPRPAEAEAPNPPRKSRRRRS